jgi:hypothetical protein
VKSSVLFEVQSFEVGSFEVVSFEVQLFEVGSFEVQSYEVRSFEVQSFEVQSVNHCVNSRTRAANWQNTFKPRIQRRHLFADLTISHLR